MAKSSSKSLSRSKPNKGKKSGAAKLPKPVKAQMAQASNSSRGKKIAKKSVPRGVAAKHGVLSTRAKKVPAGKPVLKKSVPAQSASLKTLAGKSKLAKSGAAKSKLVEKNKPAMKTIAARPAVLKATAPQLKPLLSKPVQAKPLAGKQLAVKPLQIKPAPIKPEPYQMQAAPAVATNLKPRKNQIGLGVRELEHFADLLLCQAAELVGDMSSMEREALRSGSASNLSTLPMHMADMGTDNYEQEFTLGLVEKDRNLLREINHALAKIQNGTYGICEGTGHAIGKVRLEAQPWAKFSIEYARQKEKNGMGVRTM